MAQIQKGTTYITGDQVTAANLNALADSAILLPGAITDQTAKTVPLAADTVLIHSAADTALRKSTLTQLFANATGIPISTGISGLGTGIATALAINTGSAGAPVLFNGALGTPASGTVTNLTGTASININGTVGATTASTGAFTTIGASGVITANGGSAGTASINTQFQVGVGTDIVLNGGAGYGIIVGSTRVAAFSNTTGLAVTGALSSTTGANFATSSGSVGIGTASPAAPLHIAFGSAVNDAELRIQQTTNGTASQITIAANNDGGAIYNFIRSVTTSGTEHWRIGGGATASTMAFSTNSIERARITSAGDVGIGTTSPAANLDVRGANKLFDSHGIANVYSTDTTTVGYGGSIAFGGNNGTGGTSPYPYGKIQGVKEGSTSTWSGALVFGTTASSSAVTERMRIDSSGNVGIGTASPAEKLDVRGNVAIGSRSAEANLYLYGSAGDLRVIMSTLGSGFVVDSDGVIDFKTSNTQAARIDSSGQFLVGKTSDSVANNGFHSNPNGYASFSLAGSTSATDTLNVYSTGAAAYRFYVDMAGTIRATNTTISGISDSRLKENIVDLDDGLNAILALKPRKFDWKSGKGKDIKADRGFIAQEFETVFPDLIDTWKDPAPEGEDPYKSVRADLIPVIVKALLELNANLVAQVAALSQRLAALETK